jgi:hypothetical protein
MRPVPRVVRLRLLGRVRRVVVRVALAMLRPPPPPAAPWAAVWSAGTGTVTSRP